MMYCCVFDVKMLCPLLRNHILTGIIFLTKDMHIDFLKRLVMDTCHEEVNKL